MTETYKEQKERLKVEQEGLTKEDIIERQGGIDLDNLPKQEHHWVERGIKISCEGAGHAHHSHFLVKK